MQPSTVTAWFANPSTLPSGQSLYALALNDQVCPRWLLLGERDLVRKGLPQEDWQAALRERIRRELYERAFNPSFIDRFLPEPSALAEQVVTDWLSRAVSAETKHFKEARETLHLNAIRQLRMLEDALRIYETRDPASEFPVPAISVQVRDQDLLGAGAADADVDGAAAFQGTPPGTYGKGVLDKVTFDAEAPARKAKEQAQERTKRDYLKALEEESLAIGEPARREDVKARRHR